jgi:hypothetical protein
MPAYETARQRSEETFGPSLWLGSLSECPMVVNHGSCLCNALRRPGRLPEACLRLLCCTTAHWDRRPRQSKFAPVDGETEYASRALFGRNRGLSGLSAPASLKWLGRPYSVVAVMHDFTSDYSIRMLATVERYAVLSTARGASERACDGVYRMILCWL